MELFNEIDILGFIIVLLSILLSYFRGFLRECFTVLAWAMSAILSLNLGPGLIPIIQEIPLLDEFFLGNCPLTMLVSFVLSFVILIASSSSFLAFEGKFSVAPIVLNLILLSIKVLVSLLIAETSNVISAFISDFGRSQFSVENA